MSDNYTLAVLTHPLPVFGNGAITSPPLTPHSISLAGDSGYVFRSGFKEMFKSVGFNRLHHRYMRWWQAMILPSTEEFYLLSQTLTTTR